MTKNDFYTEFSPQITDRRVRFLYRNPEARKVFVVGTFNRWHHDALPMKKNNSGEWVSDTITLNERGVYHYKFLVNGNRYIRDPLNFRQEQTPEGYKNSAFEIWHNNPELNTLLKKMGTDLPDVSLNYSEKREDYLYRLDNFLQVRSVTHASSLQQFYNNRIITLIQKLHLPVPKDCLRVFFLYNHGYIFKTPGICFGVDVVTARGVWGLGWNVPENIPPLIADHLDFMLVTHFHSDHKDISLIKEMLKQKKNVYVPEHLSPKYRGTYPVPMKKNMFGVKNIKILSYPGVHVYDMGRNIPVIYYYIHLPDGNTIMHSGDHDYTARLNHPRRVDIAVPKLGGVHPDYSTEKALNILLKKIKPRYLIAGHVIEMAHPPGGGRGSLKEAITVLNKTSVPAPLMIWGDYLDIKTRG